MALFSTILFLLGFVFGAVVIIGFEAFGLILLINWLNCNAKKEETAAEESMRKSVELNHHQSLSYDYNKQGLIWILEPDKIPKIYSMDKVPKEQNRKKEIVEVSPVKRYAKIKHHSLILTADDSDIGIPLKGCIIEAVSATSLSSRKWAKRFPIKIENKVSVLYKGSKTIYIYLETSWEKESWCKALRIASCDDKERLNWFAELNVDFHSYMTSLKTGYPSFMKTAAEIYSEPVEEGDRTDGSTSKVRLFWNKLSKKASKAGEEYKSSWTFSSGREVRKNNERYLKRQDSVSAKAPLNISEDDVVLSSRSGSQSQTSVISDADFDDKFNFDEGTLCWNLLISRLFFDAKSNKELKGPIQARIQRTLSNMRIPSYVGGLTCTDIHLGNLPPYIHGMRVLPTEMNEAWALEIDLEYSGGALLDVETRLEVRDLEDIQKELLDANLESSPVVDASSDLLEGIEDYGKQLNLSEGSAEGVEQKNEAENDGLESSKSTVPALNSVSKWKSILNSVAKQVSQVPLSLSIRVSSLRGTLQLHIKPPPSDQIWFGFVSMPDIDFKLESSVGEQRITSGHIALFLITRFKAAIRETLVLPNCESVCMPWMLAEKQDWVPRKVAPFMWVHQDPTHANENHGSQTDDMKTKKEANRGNSSDYHEKKKKSEKAEGKKSLRELGDALWRPPRPRTPPLQKSTSSQDGMLGSDTDKPSSETSHPVREMERNSSSRSSLSSDGENHNNEDDDGRQKWMGRRARMLDLRKKMGEKLEEKSRHIVEKMRGP